MAANSGAEAKAQGVAKVLGRMIVGAGIAFAGVSIGTGIALGLYFVGRGIERHGILLGGHAESLERRSEEAKMGRSLQLYCYPNAIYAFGTDEAADSACIVESDMMLRNSKPFSQMKELLQPHTNADSAASDRR
ncbi:hypothetical protein R1sor_010044 [Riccia sorocarpa]|uniref:Uncharacterized protein n=1 Tax=Riccia sorocarpa TaxID=122646 RepID=A0ABD3HWY8_9MARC